MGQPSRHRDRGHQDGQGGAEPAGEGAGRIQAEKQKREGDQHRENTCGERTGRTQQIPGVAGGIASGIAAEAASGDATGQGETTEHESPGGEISLRFALLKLRRQDNGGAQHRATGAAQQGPPAQRAVGPADERGGGRQDKGTQQRGRQKGQMAGDRIGRGHADDGPGDSARLGRGCAGVSSQGRGQLSFPHGVGSNHRGSETAETLRSRPVPLRSAPFRKERLAAVGRKQGAAR